MYSGQILAGFFVKRASTSILMGHGRGWKEAFLDGAKPLSKHDLV